MKNIIMILLAVFSLSLFSCEGLLNKTPINTGTFDNISTEKDLDMILNTVEWHVRESNATNSIYPLLIGELADAVNDEKLIKHKDFTITSSGATVTWDYIYKIDATARVVLKCIPQVEMSKDRQDYYEGSASFYIAYCYFNLVRRWGEVPLIKGDTPIGPIAKSSWAEVIDYVIEMATKASVMLPELDKIYDGKDNSITRRSTPCKGAALAILADAAAWKAGGKYHMKPEDRNFEENDYWKIAEDAASKIISNSAIYSLAPTATMICTDVLIGETPESVWEIKYRDGWTDINYRVPIVSFFNIVQNWPVTKLPHGTKGSMRYITYVPTVEKMYTDGDERKHQYFFDLADTVGRKWDFGEGNILHDAALPHKMRLARFSAEIGTKDEFLSFDQNKIEYRLSDIILLRAECRVRLGDDAGAIEDLNNVRRRAKATQYDASEDSGDLRMTIFKEREKELLWENKRYYDIIRNGYHRELLSKNHKKLTDADYIDGAFFLGITSDAFHDNQLMRQNTYWLRNR